MSWDTTILDSHKHAVQRNTLLWRPWTFDCHIFNSLSQHPLISFLYLYTQHFKISPWANQLAERMQNFGFFQNTLSVSADVYIYLHIDATDRQCRQVLFVWTCAMVTTSEGRWGPCLISRHGPHLERFGCLLPRWVTSAFLNGRACWERNPNYRLLLADEGQRCLSYTVEQRKRTRKPDLTLFPLKRCYRHAGSGTRRAPTVAVTQDKELAWSDKNLYFVGLKISTWAFEDSPWAHSTW